MAGGTSSISILLACLVVFAQAQYDSKYFLSAPAFSPSVDIWNGPHRKKKGGGMHDNPVTNDRTLHDSGLTLNVMIY